MKAARYLMLKTCKASVTGTTGLRPNRINAGGRKPQGAYSMALQTITDKILEADDTAPPAGSQVTIMWPRFASAEGKTVAAGSKTIAIAEADGAFTVQLEASDTSAPPFTYLVRLEIAGQEKAFERWLVPTSGTVKKIVDVVVTGSIAVQGATATTFTAKGDLVTFDGTSVTRLPAGTNGQALFSDSTVAKGVKWGAVPTQGLADPGANGLVLRTGANQTSNLAPGTDGQVLTADAASPGGVKFAAAAAVNSEATRTITGSSAVTGTDAFILANANGGAIIVTLPAAAAGRRYKVKKIDASVNAVTITPASGTIDGLASIDLIDQYAALTAVTDGTNWWLQ